jgi:hypothetical protein
MNILKTIVTVIVFFSITTLVKAETEEYQTALEAAKYRQEQLLIGLTKNATNPTEKARAEKSLETFRTIPEDLKDALVKQAYREAAKQ